MSNGFFNCYYSKIILSFNAFQGKYIKSLPLHHTQQIIVDNEDELQINLELFLTHDFIMELLSYGDDMKVLQPAKLIKVIKSIQEKASQQY